LLKQVINVQPLIHGVLTVEVSLAWMIASLGVSTLSSSPEVRGGVDRPESVPVQGRLSLRGCYTAKQEVLKHQQSGDIGASLPPAGELENVTLPRAPKLLKRFSW